MAAVAPCSLRRDSSRVPSSLKTTKKSENSIGFNIFFQMSCLKIDYTIMRGDMWLIYQMMTLEFGGFPLDYIWAMVVVIFENMLTFPQIRFYLIKNYGFLYIPHPLIPTFFFFSSTSPLPYCLLKKWVWDTTKGRKLALFFI